MSPSAIGFTYGYIWLSMPITGRNKRSIDYQSVIKSAMIERVPLKNVEKEDSAP